MRPPAATGAAPLPREHGAWGLLLQPFAAAAILARHWNLWLAVTLCLVFAGFLIREPLIVMFRLRKHGAPAGYAKPLRWFAVESLIAAAALGILATVGRVPVAGLTALAVFGGTFTALAVWMAVQNRQRSALLQAAAVGGLSATAFAAVLTSLGEVPVWTWWLWAILTLHGVASVLCVHARLEARIAAAKSSTAPPPDLRRKAYGATILQALAAAPAVAITGRWELAVPLLFSAAAHAWELQRLHSPEALRERLQKVGFRMLAVSITHTLLAIFALWKLARP